MAAGMPTLVIGNRNYSSWSLRPWLLMREAGLPFAEVRLALDTPEFHQRIHSYSPTGCVPVLLIDGEVVWDSLAICEVVNERWLDGRGWPADPGCRAQARSAAAEMHSGFQSLRSQLPMNCRRKPGLPHWDGRAAADIERIQGLWRGMRGRSAGQGDFLAGAFGIVDAMYAPVCVRFRTYGVPMDATCSAYVERIMAMPAMLEWLAAAVAETEFLPDTDAVGMRVVEDPGAS
jgi:glutathione S-transferase